jgi:hypothetical protein
MRSLSSHTRQRRAASGCFLYRCERGMTDKRSYGPLGFPSPSLEPNGPASPPRRPVEQAPRPTLGRRRSLVATGLVAVTPVGSDSPPVPNPTPGRPGSAARLRARAGDVARAVGMRLCALCGRVEMRGATCPCRPTRREPSWSDGNRAMCNLLHRGRSRARVRDE